MPLLLLKLTLTPLLIGGASLAARRWGPAVAGWIVALPLTSGPVLFFVALDHGPQFASGAAVGTMLGLGAIVAFSLGFVAAASRGPAASLITATACYVLAGFALQLVAGWPLLLLGALVTLGILTTLRVLPPATAGPSQARHPSWDMPARIIVGTALVVGLTTIAPLLGPTVSGIVTTFPVYVSVLSVFAFLHGGQSAAIGTLRGALIGLPGTVAFYLPIHYLLVGSGMAVAFGLSLAITAMIGAMALPRARGIGSTREELDVEMV
ncbi:MAG TPA: hypothetical protein VIR16_12090 [Candidatus Limnocylindrales bacterium]